MNYFIVDTRGIRIASCTRLFPTHCSMPHVSEHDRTILAAAELAKLLDITISGTTEQKVRHTQLVQQLTDVLKHGHPQRVNGELPRVTTPSASNNTTAPRVVRHQPQIHQRRTRSNTPMPTILEEVEESPTLTPEFDNTWYEKPRPKRNQATQKKTKQKTNNGSPKDINQEPIPIYQPATTTNVTPQ